MSRPDEYRYTTADLARDFGLKSSKTIRAKAKALGLGIDFGGRAGFRYSETDRLRLIESLKPVAKPRQSAAKERKSRGRAA